ncbi:hypothetical protein RS399_21635 [Bacillus inaquosorum]|uniref:hypothetical protein n=1 Tax=Bacillus inaquosorum TaxID=483913 RepID=UPI000A113F78|nr:hypothetical protein [Bacillus inaquosorum]ARV43892.1 hypothetical protein BCV50_02255 [Bacillus subtilis]QJC88931.1 hypothetical protein HC662_20960 [Bacillus subtilis]WNW24245.1 hypothetical protein RS399_21635 [Bacillus inaquosorum]
MNYEVPGKADHLGSDLIEKWNLEIKNIYNNLKGELNTKYFSIDPEKLINPKLTRSIKWFANPVEPEFCLGLDVAQQLSDWSVKGRHNFHDEYCEYHTINQLDVSGRMRPKRVQVTTELREYWVCVARYDPLKLRTMIQSIIGTQLSWEEIYGEDVRDPLILSEDERLIKFCTQVAGNGGDKILKDKGVPTNPEGKLNTENALFMTHPINGLDDLIFIVMFGSKPFARQSQNGILPATKEQIFRNAEAEYLSCRHADPAAAMGAHEAAFNGITVSFANPLGVYFQTFTKDVFTFQGKPLPESWIRWSRGEKGMFQRLEFGPSDDEPYFLDDITISEGQNETPLVGGYQLLKFTEVGPLILTSEPTSVPSDEFIILKTSAEEIKCDEALICNDIIKLKKEFDNLGR